MKYVQQILKKFYFIIPFSKYSYISYKIMHIQGDQWECVESKRLYIPSSISVTVLPTRVRYLRPVNFI